MIVTNKREVIVIKPNKCPDNPFVVQRLRAGLLQDDAAKVIGVDRSTVAAWELGRTYPRADKLPDIAKLYGCTIDELMGSGENASTKDIPEHG